MLLRMLAGAWNGWTKECTAKDMYIGYGIEEFPHKGVFYVMEEVAPQDGDLLSEEAGVATEKVILETDCDIQQANKMFGSGVIQNQWTVFFTFDKREGLPEGLRLGSRFRAEIHGMSVEGTVIGLWPTEVAPFKNVNTGGCTAEIKGSEV